MDEMDYAKIFDLKPEERELHILICAKPESQANLPHAEFVDQGDLRHLSYAEQSFDLVLCPNVLFVQNHIHSEDYHQQVLKELARVGGEVRVYPLVDKEGKPSQYLGLVIQGLQEGGFGVELRQIQTGDKSQANAMLRLWNPACVVKA